MVPGSVVGSGEGVVVAVGLGDGDGDAVTVGLGDGDGDVVAVGEGDGVDVPPQAPWEAQAPQAVEPGTSPWVYQLAR